MKNRLIMITGPKHSGKSTVAGVLGRITGKEAVDLDEIVESTTGKNPRELYREGPEILKKAEEKALESLVKRQGRSDLIVATGGGIIDNPGAVVLMTRHKEIVIVYLEVSPETAWQRIVQTAGSGELPPFLNTENPRETHLTLHRRRADAYKKLAQFTVSGENKRTIEIAKEIASLLGWDIIQPQET